MTPARPRWLRRLDVVRRECAEWRDRSPAERFRAAGGLMAFTIAALERQAREQGCTVGALLLRYDRAERRIRYRVS